MTNINFDEASLGQVNDDNKVALEVRNNGKGGGIKCIGTWQGLLGESTSNTGVVGVAKGEGGIGVWGETHHDKGGAGVVGKSKNWVGVYGESQTYQGVMGVSTSNVGVAGISKELWGVYGEGGIGILGKSKNWVGVYGESETGHGVWGETKADTGGAGVVGKSKNWVGVYGESDTKEGVHGECRGQQGAGVVALNTGGGIAIFARGTIAGHFEGVVDVTGDIRLLNADCAEDFDVSTRDGQTIEPGTVMVLNDDGNLEPSSQAYDKKVAGVISGAGGYNPGIVLDKHKPEEHQQSEDNIRRMPVALMGKVYCKVDATLSPIEVGDLLTTSPTEGHAMKASDSIKAFGSVVGKALKPIREEKGMIPVLVALQ